MFVQIYSLNKKKELVSKFYCLICKKKFKCRSEIQRHVDCVHKKLRPFQCCLCDKTFGQKQTRKRHEKYYHNITNPDFWDILGI